MQNAVLKLLDLRPPKADPDMAKSFTGASDP